MDKDARVVLETNIDYVLKDPSGWEKTVKYSLSQSGIEADLEQVLAFTAGDLFGIFYLFIMQKMNRKPTPKEFDEFSDIMKRRAWEIRQALIKDHLDKK